MNKGSISEIIFSLMLFLMFVIGGFLMVSYSGNIYKHIVSDGDNREATLIPLAYINEKLNQAKSKDYVSIEKIDNLDVLIIDNDTYLTCIYNDEEYLKELNITSKDKFNKDAGESIYSLDLLNMHYEDGLYIFEVTSKDISDSITIALR